MKPKKIRRVMIVHPEGDVCGMLAEAVASRGYDAYICPDGHSALQLLYDHPMDILIVALRQCGVMSGVETLFEVQQFPKSPRCILVTDHDEATVRCLLGEYGLLDIVLGVIHIPDDMDVNLICGKVSQAIRVRRRR